MKTKYRIGDMPEWHESDLYSDVVYPAEYVAVECLKERYADRDWPTTGPNEWTTTVHLSTGESVRMRAKMRPQFSVDRYVPGDIMEGFYRARRAWLWGGVRVD